jgi:hypothetical protein
MYYFCTFKLKTKNMKKLFISVLAVVTFGASAQDVNFKSKRGENMLPEKGDWALGFSTDGIFEYLGNAFNGDTNNNAPTVGFSNTVDNGFRGRFVGKYFTSDKSAYRVVFNLQSIGTGSEFSNTTADDTFILTPGVPVPNVNVTDVLTEDVTNSSTEFSIGVGKEWRRGKTRLQGFYGADILLFFSSGKSTLDRNEQRVTNVVTPAQTITEIERTEQTVKFGSGFGVGAEAFIGAEYFLFPKIAIGAQYTYGARFISQGEGKQTNVVTNSTDDTLATPRFESDVTTTVNNTPSNYNRGLTGVGGVSSNLTLHF